MQSENALLELMKKDCSICAAPLRGAGSGLPSPSSTPPNDMPGGANPVCVALCCNSMYHRDCLDIWLAQSNACPTCEDVHYKIDQAHPATRHFVTYLPDPTEHWHIYGQLHRKNLLYQTHRILKKLAADLGIQYPVFYPVSTFQTDRFISTEALRERWDEYSYGIFRDFNWTGVLVTHPATNLVYRDPLLTDETPISLTICNQDYRVAQDQLKALFNYLTELPMLKSAGPPVINVTSGLITIYVPGFVRKITVKLFYGILPELEERIYFNGQETYIDIELLRKEQRAPSLNPIWDKIYKYGESDKDFRQRTGIPCIRGYNHFYNSIYRRYTLCFTVPDGVSSSFWPIITSWVHAMERLIDVIIKEGQPLSVTLQSDDGHTISTLDSPMKLDLLRKFVRESAAYKQPTLF